MLFMKSTKQVTSHSIHNRTIKVVTTVTLNLSKITSYNNVRSGLAHGIERYWVGTNNSNVGLQYLQFKDGIITTKEFCFERSDLVVFQYLGHPGDYGFNIFVESDGSLSWNTFSGTELTIAETIEVEKHIATALTTDEFVKYLDHERRFLKEKPWLQVNGMTPKQAVAKFKELGWY